MRYKRRFFIILGLAAAAVIAFFALEQALDLARYSLPSKALRFEDLKPPSAAAILDNEGRVLDYVYGEKLSLYRPLSKISENLANFVTYLEDDKFWFHKGFDVEEIKNSIHQDLKKGKARRGASTISQQLAKNLFLDKEKSLVRKIYEVPWTMRLEKDFKKKQILELYLNIIEWGPGIYGAEAAARHYFDTTAAELQVGQAMYLALIIPNPKRFDGFQNPKMTSFIEEKRNWLVDRLVNEKKIDPGELSAYQSASMALVPPDSPERNFAVSHEGSYFGNRYHHNPALALLETKLSLIRNAGSRDIKTTLNKELWDALQAAPESRDSSDEGSASDRFVIASEDGVIRAFRPLKRGHVLDQTALDDVLESHNAELIEVESIDWNSLAL